MAEPTVREALQEHINNTPEVEVDTPVIDTPETETPEQKTERLRDEAGRFAKTEKTEVKTDPVIPEAPPELSPLQRPSSWKKELWPIWDKMAAGQPLTDKEARQVAEYSHGREQQFASGVSTYKQEAERAKPLFEAIAPYQPELDRYKAEHGVEPHTVIRNLLEAQKALALGSPQQKMIMLARIAKDYGIPLQAFSDQNVQQQYLSTPYSPPPPPQLDINKAIQEALAERETNQTIQQMASNTEKYPYFPYVRMSMAQILESGEVTDLDEAYRLALELPEHSMLSTAMQQQQSALDEQKKLEAARKTAQVARANNLSPKSATPAAATGTGKTSVREALEQAMQAHGGSSARV
jgi:hypothetical protein